jgi:hypothetical protein
MSEQINTFRDSTLNLDQAYNYTLLLLVDTNSFSCAVLYNNKLLAYEAGCAINELITPQKLQELLTVTYKNIIIGFVGNAFTLIPQNLFKTDHITDFARLLDVKENEKVLAQVLDEKNYVVYKVDDPQLVAIEKFSFKKIVFAAKGLVRVITKNGTLNNILYLNITNNKIEFLYFKHNELRFYNSFEYKNIADIVYFAVLVTQELEMKPQFTTLTLSGKVSQGDELCTQLAGFFSEASVNNVSIVELPDEIPAHQVLSLASLSLCGSSEAF